MYRNNLLNVFLAAASTGLALAQAPTPTPFVTHQLKPNVYWIEGGGGNSGVIVGDKGVVVIDAKTTPAGGKELLDDIAKITPKPVTTVILTHSDGDHVNGLASFPNGIKIIAHEGNKAEQEKALAAGGRGAPPAGHLPNQVVAKNKESEKLEGVKFEFYHWANAHTSGDLVIYLPSEKIVFTGDIIATQLPEPSIHEDKNGSSAGWITTVKGMVKLDSDVFVPGHGVVQSKSDIQERLTRIEKKREQIKMLVAQGKSLDEIKQIAGDVPLPAPGGGRGPGPPSFTTMVYNELTKK